MQRGPKRKKRTARPRRTEREPSSGRQRIQSLDLLRGVAIVLMIVDHVAYYLFQQNIEPGSVRLWTRLSMPLFCVLAGFLASAKWGDNKTLELRLKATNWRRLAEVAVAMLVVNLLYYPTSGKLEILASLLISYLLAILAGTHFKWACLAFLVFPFDMTARVLDFPLSVVATCFATGVLLASYRLEQSSRYSLGISAGIAAGLLLLSGFQGGHVLVTTPSVYVLLFLPFAVALTYAGLVWRNWRLPFDGFPLLNWVGRYPLIVYTLQYVVLLGLHRFASESG